MSSDALMERPTATVTPMVTAEQLELVKRTVAHGATADELKLYLYDCQRQGVHPLDKLIHFTKRSGKYTPITSIDFMRIRAADTGEYAGSDDARYEEEPNHPGTATVTVYRMTQGQRFPYTATAYWSEYKPEANDFMWKKMPHTMLAKCAEALALRKSFPRQLAGLYAKEEMDQAGNGQGLTIVAEAPPAETVAELPEGAVLFVRVEAGSGALKGRAVTHAGEELAIFDDRLRGLVEELVQERTPCLPEIAMSKSGRPYLKGAKRLPTKAQATTESPEELAF